MESDYQENINQQNVNQQNAAINYNRRYYQPYEVTSNEKYEEPTKRVSPNFAYKMNSDQQSDETSWNEKIQETDDFTQNQENYHYSSSSSPDYQIMSDAKEAAANNEQINLYQPKLRSSSIENVEHSANRNPSSFNLQDNYSNDNYRSANFGQQTSTININLPYYENKKEYNTRNQYKSANIEGTNRASGAVNKVCFAINLFVAYFNDIILTSLLFLRILQLAEVTEMIMAQI